MAKLRQSAYLDPTGTVGKAHHNRESRLLTWLQVDQAQPVKRSGDLDKITADNTKANTGVPAKETLAKIKNGATTVPLQEEHNTRPPPPLLPPPGSPLHHPAARPAPVLGRDGKPVVARASRPYHRTISGKPRRPPKKSTKERLPGMDAPPRRPPKKSTKERLSGMDAPPRRPSDLSKLPDSLKPKPNPSSSATGIKGAPIRPATKKP